MFYRVVVFIVNIIFKIIFRIKVTGEFEYSEDNRYILCANHAGLLDPIFLALVYKEPIHFMAKEELFKNKLLAFIVSKLHAFPVDREGNDLKALKKSVKTLKEGNTLGIFIEGRRVKEYNPKNAKSGPILIANMANAKIIPIKIESDYKLFSKVNIIVRKSFEINKLELKNDKEHGYSNKAQELLRIIYKGD